MAGFYDRRFGVSLDPATEIIPALGAKEAIANLNLALLDPGDVALASDPGYPVYTNGPLLVGAEPVAMPLVPELGFQPDLAAIPADVLGRARIMAPVDEAPDRNSEEDRQERKGGGDGAEPDDG